MYRIKKAFYGYRLTFEGFIKADEMAQWVADSREALDSGGDGFGVFVDMRKLKPLPQDSQRSMVEGQKLYKRKGMVRSVVILDIALTTIQFQRIAKETGIYEWERYIDASSRPDWEQLSLDWIKSAVDPDADAA